MALEKKEFSTYIKQFRFRELFNDMGWNNDKTTQPIVVDNETFALRAVAEKSGFKILLCDPLSNGLIPEYKTRKKIESKVTKLFQEHLIIFFDNRKTEQIWQLMVRQSGMPTKVSETRWHINQDAELLYQRAAGIFFEIDEEEHITIIDVTKRIADNFHQNNEKVTKQFYDKFKKEHGAFLQFIKGISDKTNQEWYASLMLNRLMFCYFIQKKGFLDNNKNYLRDKLLACKSKRGKIKFYSFYRDFLLVLFHKGLNEPTQSPDTKIEIGKIPYLNGGLFDVHELEISNASIDIDDTAFERLFDFFDQYEWHLDTRHSASGKDINPDVIGYIFEKYINDRANMGAYYTKEDITDYISKNCILPYLFDETKRHYPKAFNADAELWQMVKQSGDLYIYESVKKGVKETLPKEIEQGIGDPSKRTEWNKSAIINYALPTEIWREVVERRGRYNGVKNKIDKGDIQQINDFITYNLNIRQFAQDVVESTDDPELLKSFYKALNGVTIIDPTCGSGAFLFAAMNILEPLYEGCLQRMENFVVEAPKGKYKFFEETLAQVKSPAHPNLQYFIYKSIILQNLYGVDIMKEAVEIAKLRLFLKLVATVEADYRKPNLGLEPLPDIDFNIRAGNTLVGFATESELQKGLTYTLDGAIAKPLIEEKCEIVANAFKRYKEIQLKYGDDLIEFKRAKAELNKRLEELNHELNQLLHIQASGLKYETWLKTHQPFHWFAEFYENIKENGGFDIVIGNPPYVEYSKARKDYTVSGYSAISSGNLFALVTERAKKIISQQGYFSFIVPISFVCTQRMEVIQKLCFNLNTVWLSHYGERPSKLFTGAEVLLTIFIVAPQSEVSTIYSTAFIKWKSEERPHLFNKIAYNKVAFKPKSFSIPKIGCEVENSILKKMMGGKRSLALDLLKESGNRIYYRVGGGRYWKIFTDFSPKFVLNGVETISSRENYLFAKSNEEKNAIISILSSSLFYWYFVMTTNCRDLNPSDLKEFPITPSSLDAKVINKLSVFCEKLMIDYREHSKLKEKVSGKTGNIIYQEYYPRLSKSIIDEIDTVLGNYCGFTEDELDFIINYDVKCRIGKEMEEEDEE